MLNNKLREMPLFPFFKKSALPLVILITAGYVGNYFSLPLFFGVDFVFGSIAVLIVVLLFGTLWGTIAAIIAGGYTILVWNHPYAAIIATCEALFVGLLLRRKNQNMVLLDGIYWVLIGMPLVWIFYGTIMDMPAIPTSLIMLKQAVNGIFNALVSSLIITCLPIHKWVKSRKVKQALSLRQILLNLLVAFVFFPTILLMSLENQRVINNRTHIIQAELTATSQQVAAELIFWHEENLNALSALAKFAAKSDMAPSDRLQENTEILQQTFPNFNNIYLVNEAGSIIAASPTTNKEKTLKIGVNVSDNYIFNAIKTALQPVKSEVQVNSNLLIPQIDLGVPVLGENRFRGIAFASLDLPDISQLLKNNIIAQDMQVTLVDTRGFIIASTQSERVVMERFDRRRGGQIKEINGAIYQWLPPKENLPPIMQRRNSFYVEEIPIGGNIPWTLVVEIPAAKQVNYLESIYIIALALMILIAMVALILAIFLSRGLVSPLLQLAGVTTDLPNRLWEREAINWPNSQVAEISSLVHNFKFMAIALQEKFQEIKQANETLEQRVQKRTRQLLETNGKLENEIVERQQVQEQLYRRQQEFKALLENAPDAIMRLDREIRYVYVNPAVERISGMPSNAFIGKSPPELGSPEELSQLWEKTLRKVFETGEEQAIEFETETLNGLCTFQSRVVPELNKEGAIASALVVSRDITDRKQAEEKIRTMNAELEQRVIERTAQLEAANQIKDDLLFREQAARADAEAANRMKDDFLATVSHELRTPLNSMLGWAKLLRSRKFDEVTTAKALETIERNAKSQAQLIDDILDVSRIIRGKFSLNIRPIELIPLINLALDTVRPAAESKSVRLESVLDPSVGTVLGDSDRLQQIIWNLLSNAIKFTPEGGKVEIRLSVVREELSGSNSVPTPMNNYAQITVSDTGKGISPDFLPYVFERFRQADSSITRSHGGLGLGLAIVRHLVELHGGTVRASSPGVGKGSTFTVRLPLIDRGLGTQKDSLPTPITNHQSSISLLGLRVLLVDDEADTREVIKVALEEWGAEVTAVESAIAAFQTLEDSQPDVLVSDIGMPEEDGYALIRKIRMRDSHAGGEIPAVALTAYASDRDRAFAMAAGFQRHIPKPVEPSKLADAIAQLARRSS